MVTFDRMCEEVREALEALGEPATASPGGGGAPIPQFAAEPGSNRLSTDEKRILAMALASRWTVGVRHTLALALGGVMARCGVPMHEASSVLEAVMEQAGDQEYVDRNKAIDTSYQRVAEGKSVASWSVIAATYGEDALLDIRSILKELQPPEGTLGEKQEGFRYWNGPDFMRADFPPPRWLWDKFIPSGAVTILGGEPKAGKSTAIANLFAEIATSLLGGHGEFLGHRVSACRAMYVNLEDPPFLTRERIVKALRGDIPDGIYVADKPKGYFASWGGELAHIVKAEGIRLVVLDPMLRTFGFVNENDNAEADRLLAQAVQFAEDTLAAVVIVHHTSKPIRDKWGGKKKAPTLRGASAIVGAVQGSILLDRDEGGDTGKFWTVGKYCESFGVGARLDRKTQVWEAEDRLEVSGLE